MESTSALAGLSPVSWGVLFFLSLYFIAIFWIFVSRLLTLSQWIDRESDASDSLIRSGEVSARSVLIGCSKRSQGTLDVCLHAATKEATKGLTWLSIMASTSPFLGLFGTVVSILQTFSTMSQQGATSVTQLAPQISEALIATAAGIFVAIFAYAFHMLLKRKAYEVITLVKMQIDFYHKGI